MSYKLDMADVWLIDEIAKELKLKGISEIEAKKLIKTSNFMTLLQSMPNQVHHESPKSWAVSIFNQNDSSLRSMSVLV